VRFGFGDHGLGKLNNPSQTIDDWLVRERHSPSAPGLFLIAQLP
jgi:hypothetical protein